MIIERSYISWYSEFVFRFIRLFINHQLFQPITSRGYSIPPITEDNDLCSTQFLLFQLFYSREIHLFICKMINDK